MKFTEEQLKCYAQPLSDTENSKCLHTIKAIRDALKNLGYHTDSDAILPLEEGTYSYAVRLKRYRSDEEIEIFIQGSYANNTCVHGESDVDLAVIRKDIYEYAVGNGREIGIPRIQHYGAATHFKNTVERVLRDHFTSSYVHRKNKSIKVDGNTYRKQSDIVPSFGMRQIYRHDGDFSYYNEGVIIYADDGQVISNFPKQHIARGREKNVATNHYYKKMVRIAKKLRYMMEKLEYTGAMNVSSFGVESLLWNVPDCVFKRYITYGYEFEEVASYLYDYRSFLNTFKEANGIKILCQDSETIKNYTRFIEEMYGFFDYEN